MIACPARGQIGNGNIHVHSLKDKRCICDVCGQTFTTTKSTIFYRLRIDPQIVMYVIVSFAYGCPIQAIVKAFLLDERTVQDWQQRAGNHCQQVHKHLIENSQHDLEQVQADEIKAKTQLGTLWMVFVIWVPTRLWMGGVVSPKRDLDLIRCLADKIRQMALCRPFLLAVDGLASYVSAFQNAFWNKFPRPSGETGHCKLVSCPNIAIVQMVKQRVEGVLNVSDGLCKVQKTWSRTHSKDTMTRCDQ